MILNSDQNSLLIVDDNSKLLIRNLNEYTILKYKHYNGKRINLKIGNIQVIETYNDGIFNVIVTNENNDQLKFQIHDKIEFCKRILFNDEKLIKDFINESKKDDINQQFLIKSLSAFFDKLKFLKDGIEINEIFKIDNNGQAYFKNNNNWNFLCIVAVNHKNFKYIDDIGLGNIEIDFRTMEILHKTLFLLNPNLDDGIFMNQLPLKLKEILKNDH
jgi:hypothetical protein